MRQARLITGVVAFVGALTVAALIWIGFPQPVMRRLLSSINAGEFFFQVQRLTLDWRGGLVAREVRAYRKGVPGAPCLEAREVRVLFNVLHPGAAGWGRLKSVSVRNGLVRPLFQPPATPAVEERQVAGIPLPSGHPLGLAVTFEQFDCLGVWIESVSGLIHLDAKGGDISEASGTIGRDQQRGGLQGQCSWTWKGSVQGKLATSFDPHVLAPLCRVADLRQTCEWLDWFSFPSAPPGCDVTFDYVPGTGRLQVKGRMQASDFAYRGAGIAFANIVGAYDGSPGQRRITLSPMVLVVGSRNVSGNVEVEFDAGRVNLEVASTIDVPTLARIAGLREGGVLDQCRFGRGTRIYAKGTVGYEDAACSDLEALVEGPEIGVGRVTTDECAFKFLMKGTTNLLADVRGKMGGGSFAGSAAFLPEGPGVDAHTRYQVKGELFHVDFQWVKNLMDTNSTVAIEGKLYGSMDLAGRFGAGQGATAVGQGYVSLRHGFAFRLPLFGGMTEVLTKALPGLDFALKQTDVRIPFEVREGRIATRDAQIEGDILSLTAKGDCTFDGQLSFDVQVRPMKDTTLMGQAMRALSYPLSRLFEFRLDGTLDKPHWSLFNLPRDSRSADRHQKDKKS